jgi:hypothetical protein
MLNNTTLGVGKFWEKETLGSILGEHLLLELHNPQTLPCAYHLVIYVCLGLSDKCLSHKFY